MIKIVEDLCVIEYLLEGLTHRPNGPAMLWHSRWYEWYLFGKQHRYYGPVHNVPSAAPFWCIHGEKITQ
jgi:hypothetical protein